MNLEKFMKRKFYGKKTSEKKYKRWIFSFIKFLEQLLSKKDEKNPNLVFYLFVVVPVERIELAIEEFYLSNKYSVADGRNMDVAYEIVMSFFKGRKKSIAKILHLKGYFKISISNHKM